MPTDKLISPTALAERLATEEQLYFPPRRLTAKAKRGEIESVTTAEGKTLLVDNARTREILRFGKR